LGVREVDNNGNRNLGNTGCIISVNFTFLSHPKCVPDPVISTYSQRQSGE